MKTFLKIAIFFLALVGLSTLLSRDLNIPLGNENFWNNRGIFFLVFVTLFPRLTLLFSSVASGGLLWWLAWLFTPRFLVAFLATITYWNQNPVLVLIAWLVAISGESSEKTVVINRGRKRNFQFSYTTGGRRNRGPHFQDETTVDNPSGPYKINDSTIVETEFREKN